ncbi:DUF2029 domain-containing protein [Rhodobacteraceae bacterium D3-12]|nr:DUF2029 domain-containing protein [Rhodobacteraceae bacterium D3-12]
MSEHFDPQPLLRLRPQTLRTTFLALGLLIVVTAIQIGAPQLLGQTPGTIDYLIFHHVGELANAGRLPLAYDAAAFEAYQAARPQGGPFMPWTYPPQFNLITQGLAIFPAGIGYALFIALGMAALVCTLYRLSSQHAAAAILLTLPAWLMNIRAGQNGFLTALLFALTFLLILRARPAAGGGALGLLAYKPHLGLGVGLVALFRGGWKLVLSAALTLLFTLALATWVYGVEIWPAFLQSVRDSGAFLRAGAYPMERMTSVFALLTSFGIGPAIALPAQALMALTCLSLVGYALLRSWPMPYVLALSVIAGLGVSPYGYDYDLIALAPALALASPALARHARTRERHTLIAALLLATGWGLLTVILNRPLAMLPFSPPALGAIGYLATLTLSFRILSRAHTHNPA